LVGLSWVAIVIVIGILISFLSSKIKLPDMLLLIITGFALSLLNININKFLPSEVITAFALFALIMMVFNSTKDLKVREIKQLSPFSFKLAIIFFIVIIALMPLPVFLLFTQDGYLIKSLLLALLFSLLMSGTSPSTVLTLFKDLKNKFLDILKFESILNSPLVVILPLIVFSFYVGKQPEIPYTIFFLENIVLGIGIGIVFSYFACRLISWISKERISPLLIVALALLSYVLSENLGGNGILTVTAFGIIYGRSNIKQKVEFKSFTDLFTTFLKIIVFILLGLMMDISYYTKPFLIKALLLFVLYITIRFISVNIAFSKSKVTIKEKIFLTMNASKGLGEGIIVLILGTYHIQQVDQILQLVLLFIILTILLSTISVKLSKKLIKFREEEKNVMKRIKTKKKKS